MDKKPNILLVSFDDAVAPWPYKTAFEEPLQTPNLDRLCKVSTAFHSAYAQAPICGPSRASMMTARMPTELGILDNSTFVFDKVEPHQAWSYLLKKNGYYCSSGGKVHHRYKPLRPADHRVLYSDERKAFSDDMGLPRDLRKRAIHYGGNRNGRATPDGLDDDFYYDAQSADSALRFLTSYMGDQPFYREVGFFSPHVPHLTPARFKDMYEVSNFRRPADWTGYIGDNPYLSSTIPEKVELRSEDWWRKSVRNYFSAYSHGDYHLGRVLDGLAASQHAERTIVVLVSDHGFHLGSRNLFRKSTMFEQSLHVPLIIFDPAVPVGQIVNDPVGLIDVGPTVLDYAGIVQAGLGHGQSLRPQMSGARFPDRAVPSFFRSNASVRKGQYRIIRYGDGSFQLFDVSEDRWQLHDLGISHPAFSEMKTILIDQMKSCGFNPDLSDGYQFSGADEDEIQEE